MLKDLQEDRFTSHYSGRDYDHLKSSLDRMLDEKSRLKNTLLIRLTEALKGQDETTVRNVFLTVNEVLN